MSTISTSGIAPSSVIRVEQQKQIDKLKELVNKLTK